MSIPDYVAGLMYGFTGDNNLTEIEACYNGGTGIVTHAEGALALLEAGELIKFSKAALALKTELAAELATCESMGGDLARLEEWATIFTEPVKLAEDVGKNYVLHSRGIKKDISAVETEWSTGSFFKSGISTADALTLALGPVPNAAPTAVANDLMAVPDFIAGMVFGFTGDNDLTEIEACYAGGASTVTDAKTLLQELECGDYFHAMILGTKLWEEVLASMATCEGMGDDLARIGAWATIFEQPVRLSETAGKNYLLHGRAFKKDIAAEETDWSTGNYFNAGIDTADALVLLLGPVV